MNIVEHNTTQDAATRYENKSFAYSMLRELPRNFQGTPSLPLPVHDNQLERMNDIVRYEEIAVCNGYSSAPAFGRAFRAKYHELPSTYRTGHRQLNYDERRAAGYFWFWRRYNIFILYIRLRGKPESVPILETDRTFPTNCYGETKLAMEKMMGWTSRAHGLRYVTLRYFNACGAHLSGRIGEAHDPETHLIPLILQVPNGKRDKISVYGDDYPTHDGTCVRDYIHVTDLAQAHILALDYLMNGGENNVFNLGNGVGFTVKEVIDVARAVTGHPIPAETAPRRAGDPAQLVASLEKAKSVLGWKPRYDDLNAIVSSAWAWHKSHPNGYEA